MQEPKETAHLPAPEPILIGYTAKRVEKRPDWLKAAGVEEICSLSNCISGGVPDAIEHWSHNSLLLYDDEPALDRILQHEPDPRAYTLFAYKLMSLSFGPKSEAAIEMGDLPDRAGSRPIPAAVPVDYEKLGYDCVQTEWHISVAGFGCSPLSCNGLALEIPVNRYCLIDTIDDAIAAARTVAREQPEPGVYYVVEVWRKRRGD